LHNYAVCRHFSAWRDLIGREGYEKTCH
jgi:hypothetical protein